MDEFGAENWMRGRGIDGQVDGQEVGMAESLILETDTFEVEMLNESKDRVKERKWMDVSRKLLGVFFPRKLQGPVLMK